MPLSVSTSGKTLFTLATLAFFFSFASHADYVTVNNNFRDFLANTNGDDFDQNEFLTNQVNPSYQMFSAPSEHEGTTFILYAARRGLWPIVSAMLQKVGPCLDNIDHVAFRGPHAGIPLAWYAATAKQTEILRQIFKYYPNVNVNLGPTHNGVVQHSILMVLLEDLTFGAEFLIKSLRETAAVIYDKSLPVEELTPLWHIAHSLLDVHLAHVLSTNQVVNVNTAPASKPTETVFSLALAKKHWRSVELMLDKHQPSLATMAEVKLLIGFNAAVQAGQHSVAQKIIHRITEVPHLRMAFMIILLLHEERSLAAQLLPKEPTHGEDLSIRNPLLFPVSSTHRVFFALFHSYLNAHDIFSHASESEKFSLESDCPELFATFKRAHETYRNYPDKNDAVFRDKIYKRIIKEHACLEVLDHDFIFKIRSAFDLATSRRQLTQDAV